MARPRSKPQKEDDKSLYWLGGGFALGAGILAAAGAVTIPPHVGALLWFMALSMCIHGVTRFTKWISIPSSFALLFVAYALWQASSPHAEIRFTKMNVRTDTKTGQLRAEYRYVNRGKEKAYVRAVSVVMEVRLTGDLATALRKAESGVSAAADRQLKGWTEVLESGSESGELSYTQNHQLQLALPEYGRDTANRVFLVALIGYRDWWPFEKTTRICGFLPNGVVGEIAMCGTQNDGLLRLP